MAKNGKQDRTALEDFEALYCDADLGITMLDLVEHIRRDRAGVLALGRDVGLQDADLDLLLEADRLADELLGKFRRLEETRPWEPGEVYWREEVRRLRAAARMTPPAGSAQQEPQYGKLPAAWEQLLAQFLHDGGSLREFVAMRDHVTPEQLEVPEPWPAEAAFAEYALGRAWRASGGTIEELLALPSDDRAALLEAHRAGMVQL